MFSQFSHGKVHTSVVRRGRAAAARRAVMRVGVSTRPAARDWSAPAGSVKKASGPVA